MKVYFIGAGPGDLELLTIKAKKVIKKADIIIFAGSLINKDILKFAKKGAKIYDSSSMHLEEILNIISKAKSTDKIVARIHSGDISIYSALQEQIDWCQQQKIECYVIPGISSYQAAAATLKQELTLPGVSQTVILTRIAGKTKVPAKEDLQKLAKSKSTLVIFLSVDKIDQVVEKLKKSYKLNTPIAIIEKASLPEERKVTGVLRNIVRKVKAAGIKRQAIIIVGEVLKKNYQKSKLYDKNFEHTFRKKNEDSNCCNK